jgi:purine nucleoside permease
MHSSLSPTTPPPSSAAVGGDGTVARSRVLDGVRALSWRQQFQFSKSYRLDMLGGAATLDVRQIEMGEVRGARVGGHAALGLCLPGGARGAR